MKRRALALISGGLDSILAAKVIMKQHIAVEGLCFVMQFASRDIDKFKAQVQKASVAAGIKVRFIDISREFLGLLHEPGHGFGANINPCIDCKIMMLRKAKDMMITENASFVITGEVLGERPMSQRKDALNLIEKNSGLAGLLLRPLSAKLLKVTVPETMGIVDRGKLMEISGRSRASQFALAEEMGITEYFTPGGGCLLTDPIFSRKLKDLLQAGDLTPDNVDLLKYGRHFRLDRFTKVVVGRNEKENGELRDLKKKEDILLRIKKYPGPYVLLRGDTGVNNIRTAGALAVSYSKQKKGDPVEIEYIADPEKRLSFRASSLSRKELSAFGIRDSRRDK